MSTPFCKNMHSKVAANRFVGSDGRERCLVCKRIAEEKRNRKRATKFEIIEPTVEFITADQIPERTTHVSKNYWHRQMQRLQFMKSREALLISWDQMVLSSFMPIYRAAERQGFSVNIRLTSKGIYVQKM